MSDSDSCRNKEDKCNFFNLWNHDEDRLSDWCEKLGEEHDTSIDVGIRSEEYLQEICNEAGIDSENLDYSEKKMLTAAEEHRKDLGLPRNCPHDPVSDKNVCVFHLEPGERRKENFSQKDITSLILEKIDQGFENKSEVNKCFAGGYFNEISLSYKGINTDSNRPIQFHFAKIDNLNLSEAIINERLVFDHATINDIDCEKTRFQESVSFTDSEIESTLDFEGAEFNGDFDLSNSSIKTDKVNFRSCIFNGAVRLNNIEVVFDNLSNIDCLQFNNSKFFGELIHKNASYNHLNPDTATEIYLEFKNCRFLSKVDFSGSEIGVSGNNSESEGNPLDLIEPDDQNISRSHKDYNLDWYLDFGKSSFESDLMLNEIGLNGTLNMADISVKNGRFNLSNESAKLRNVYISESNFDLNKLKIHDLNIQGSLIMNNLNCDTSGGKITIEGISVSKLFSLNGSSLSGNNILIKNIQTDPSSSKTNDNILSGDFKEINFNANRTEISNLDMKFAIEFNRSSYSGKRSIFYNLNTDGELSFSEAILDTRNFKFAEMHSGSGYINLKGAVLFAGTIVIDHRDVIYDFEEAEVGDVSIKTQEDLDVELIFEHFIFNKTVFNRFDFNQPLVKEGIISSNGRIHTSHAMEPQNTGLLGSTFELIKPDYKNSSYTPNELETTYMEAKLGAKENGDPNAVSKFFQRELHYRRHGYAYEFWNGDSSNRIVISFLKKINLARNWLSNITLWATCGYGEKPSYIFLSSLTIVGVFSLLYSSTKGLPNEPGMIEYLTYSFQGFIQLIVGVDPSGGAIFRLLTAFEGFLGAFLIALFVLTLTRSIER